MNSPDCRAAATPGHVCVDKFGEPWDRPNAGPRSGAACWYETLSALEDERRVGRMVNEAFSQMRHPSSRESVQ